MLLMCEVDLKPEVPLHLCPPLYMLRDDLEECTSSRAQHKTCDWDGMSSRSRIVIRSLSLFGARDGKIASPHSNDSQCAGTSAIRTSTTSIIQANRGSLVAARRIPDSAWMTDRVPRRNTGCPPKDARVHPHKTLASRRSELW